MLIFHGGLPRSGKSYEAMVSRIIPALAAGRPVVAYIEGLDHAKIAPLAGIELEECKRLLTALTREQVRPVPFKLPNGDEDKRKPAAQPLLDHQIPNALYVLDEAQNFWPVMTKLTPEFTEFVTEHGHHGQDLVLMGQDYRDVCTLFRRRLELRLEFLKLSGIGLESRYSATTYRHLGRDKYEKVGTKTAKYDPKYFGTYRSHVSDDTNKGNYKERRATVWSSSLMRYGIPLALIAGAWGFWNLYHYFRPGTAPLAVASSGARPGAPGAAVPAAAAASANSYIADGRTPQERLLTEHSDKYRIRLAGYIRRGDRVAGVVDCLDGGARVVERLRLDDLRDMGVGIVANENFVHLVIGKFDTLATMWPLEVDGKVSDNRQDALRREAGQGAIASSQAPALAGSLGGAGTRLVVDQVTPRPESVGDPVIVHNARPPLP